MKRRKSATPKERDEFVDGVVYAAAELVRAFNMETEPEHLLRMIGEDKRGAQPDEFRLRRLRSDIRKSDAAKRLRGTR